MTQEEKFKAILQRAMHNGFKLLKPKHVLLIGEDVLGRYTGEISGYETIIFDPNFARAYFGSKEEAYGYPEWKERLRTMILKEGYIDYLYNFIDHTTTDKGDK